MEGVFTHFHDDKGLAFRWTEFAGTAQDAVVYEWVGISQALPVPAHQLALLAKV